jgi:hypothetical protein
MGATSIRNLAREANTSMNADDGVVNLVKKLPLTVFKALTT